MKKTKKMCLAGITATALCACALAATACNKPMTAHADYNADEQIVDTLDNQAETRGLYTQIKVYLKGSDGVIYATAKNSFTVFPSNVQVYIELYSSDTYQDNYKDMTQVCRNYISDLNIGKTIETSASTGGVQKYWKGRAFYCVDGKGWRDAVTETLLYNAQGEVVS